MMTAPADLLTPPNRTPRVRIACLVVALLAMVISVLSWPRFRYGTDPIAVREETRAILLRGELNVDPNAYAPLARPGQFYAQNSRNGLWYSKYGIFGSIASIPPLAAERLFSGELPPTEGKHRIVYLNIWNTLLTGAVAWLLMRIALGYTRRPLVAGGFVLVCLFSTFCWNYLRAQATEIVQLLLALFAFDGWLRHRRSGSRAGVIVAWVSVGALALTRSTFVLLVPAVALAVLIQHRGRRMPLWLAPPVVIAGLLFGVNFVKFGSPFLTGYEQWEPQQHVPSLQLGAGLWGFLVSSQRSIWWCFPLTLLALAGWPLFWRNFRGEAIFLIATGIATVLFTSSFTSWAGEWCYGPRYLLFGLPLICLPAISLADWMIVRRNALTRIATVVTMILLGYSTWLQVQVNRFEFFAYYRLKEPLRKAFLAAPSYPAEHYFTSRPFGQINADFLASGGQLERTPWGADTLARQSAADVVTYRRDLARQYKLRNSFWWPDAGAEPPAGD